MNKIKFIKENDMFNWEIDEVAFYQEEDKEWIITRGVKYIYFTEEEIAKAIENSYAVYVEDSLVDKLIDKWIKTNDKLHIKCRNITSKYDCIELYDYIVTELNGAWKPNWVDDDESKYMIYYNYYKNIYDIEDWTNAMYGLSVAKSEEIIQAIIDSKKMREYLDKIFNVNQWTKGDVFDFNKL